MAADCLFCKIRDKQIPATIVHEDEHTLAFRDISPQAPTHVLVIPKKHLESVAHAGPEDVELLGRLVYTARTLAEREGVTGSGFRLVLNNGRGAGQSVFHLHMHILGGRAMQWPPG